MILPTSPKEFIQEAPSGILKELESFEPLEVSELEALRILQTMVPRE